jgi:two-component system sensor histidine kinase UhpB
MPLSLRLRLILLPALVVLFGVGLLASLETGEAKRRVAAESEASLEMSRLLVAAAIASVRDETDVGSAQARLQAALPTAARHVRFEVVTTPESNLEATAQSGEAPAWFVRMVAPPEIIERHPVFTAAGRAGEVVVSAAPGDEIAEVWASWRSQILMLGLISVAIIAVVLVALGLALRPVRQLSEALDRLEAGDLSPRVDSSSDPFLRRLLQRFNNLAGALETISRDNQRLSAQLIDQRRLREEAAGKNDFSPREFHLLSLLATGKTLGQASGDLGVSYRTTAEEAARLRARLGLRTNVELIKFAVESGFAEPERAGV